MNNNQEEKIGMTDGDDSQELQPTCMRATCRSQAIADMTRDINNYIAYQSPMHIRLAEYLYDLGYRK